MDYPGSGTRCFGAHASQSKVVRVLGRPRPYLEAVDTGCDFLSRECSNALAFDWCYQVARTIGDYTYEFPLGRTFVWAWAPRFGTVVLASRPQTWGCLGGEDGSAAEQNRQQ